MLAKLAPDWTVLTHFVSLHGRPVVFSGLEVKYGVATMQGWRKYQEDTWSVLADDPDWLIFSVFDGHGGTSTSETCRVTTDMLTLATA